VTIKVLFNFERPLRCQTAFGCQIQTIVNVISLTMKWSDIWPLKKNRFYYSQKTSRKIRYR